MHKKTSTFSGNVGIPLTILNTSSSFTFIAQLELYCKIIIDSSLTDKTHHSENFEHKSIWLFSNSIRQPIRMSINRPIRLQSQTNLLINILKLNWNPIFKKFLFINFLQKWYGLNVYIDRIKTCNSCKWRTYSPNGIVLVFR